MYHITGFTKTQITDLCERVESESRDLSKPPWPPILGVYLAVVVTLAYLRKNRVQAELAETYGVSQPTISRAITAVTPILRTALDEFVSVAEDLDQRHPYVVDGTLLPCWSWATHPELYSGKHKRTGLNVQVACTIEGRLRWISDPVDGCRHDSFALNESGVLITLDPSQWIGDKGYVGNGMLTPIKKPECRELLDWEREFNSQVNKLRYVVEQVIANLKTWRIFHTDYRRPLKTFKETISTVIALHFYKIA